MDQLLPNVKKVSVPGKNMEVAQHGPRYKRCISVGGQLLENLTKGYNAQPKLLIANYDFVWGFFIEFPCNAFDQREKFCKSLSASLEQQASPRKWQELLI